MFIDQLNVLKRNKTVEKFQLLDQFRKNRRQGLKIKRKIIFYQRALVKNQFSEKEIKNALSPISQNRIIYISSDNSIIKLDISIKNLNETIFINLINSQISKHKIENILYFDNNLSDSIILAVSQLDLQTVVHLVTDYLNNQ